MFKSFVKNNSSKYESLFALKNKIKKQTKKILVSFNLYNRNGNLLVTFLLENITKDGILAKDNFSEKRHRAWYFWSGQSKYNMIRNMSKLNLVYKKAYFGEKLFSSLFNDFSLVYRQYGISLRFILFSEKQKGKLGERNTCLLIYLFIFFLHLIFWSKFSNIPTYKLFYHNIS